MRSERPNARPSSWFVESAGGRTRSSACEHRIRARVQRTQPVSGCIKPWLKPVAALLREPGRLLGVFGARARGIGAALPYPVTGALGTDSDLETNM
jgi:hypothetical protein